MDCLLCIDKSQTYIDGKKSMSKYDDYNSNDSDSSDRYIIDQVPDSPVGHTEILDVTNLNDNINESSTIPRSASFNSSNKSKLTVSSNEFIPKSLSNINLSYSFPYSHKCPGPFYSIDVECVANGYGHIDRVPARVSIVNSNKQVIYSSYIKPSCNITSYLTELTGITSEQLEDAPDLNTVKQQIKNFLPPYCILVGQGISQDIKWLELQKDVDYLNSIDIKYFFSISTEELRKYNPYYTNTYTNLFFSLRHEVFYLFGIDIQSGIHDPSVDAFYSMELFLLYRHSLIEDMRSTTLYLASCNPRLMSYSFSQPSYESVSMKCDDNCDKRCRSTYVHEILL